MFDCDGEEIQDLVENEVLEPEPKTIETVTNEPIVNTDVVSLSNQSEDPEIKSDAQLTDALDQLVKNSETSVRFTPIMSQLRVTLEKARRQLKKRIANSEDKGVYY